MSGPGEDREACGILLGRHRGALTKWEEDFLESVLDRLDDGLGLTPRQQEVFDGVWRRVVGG